MKTPALAVILILYSCISFTRRTSTLQPVCAGSEDVVKDAKGTGVGSGRYFPLAAAQRWDLAADSIQNGVYLSHLAALEFMGKMVITKVRQPLPASLNPTSLISTPTTIFNHRVCADGTKHVLRRSGAVGAAVWAMQSCPPAV